MKALNEVSVISSVFFRTQRRIETAYFMNGVELKLLDVVKDLGVFFDSRVTFRDHYASVVSKAMSALGFIIRMAHGFSFISLKTLYCSLVRSQLEYASVIWSPIYAVHIDNLEHVHRKFINICEYKFRHQVPQFSFDSLSNRRIVSDLCFLFKIINGLIDCPELLKKISIKVPI